MDSFKYAIIGTSAAGTGAVEGIREVDEEGSIAIISYEDMLPYSRCMISYYIADKVDRDGILFKSKDFYEKMNATPILGKKVVNIDPEERFLILEGGREIGFEKLVIATGSSAVVYDIPGHDLENVMVLRTFEDARAISKVAAPGKKAAVLGGGLVGLKAADALKARGVEVWVLITSPQVMSQTMDMEGAAILEKQLRKNGINVMTETSVAEIRGSGKVESIKLKSGDVMEMDMVVFAKGVYPNIDLAIEAGMETNYGILVDEHLESNVEGIYAAGDVAEAPDLISGGKYSHGIWPNAVEQGKIAGMNMAGVEVTYAGGFGMNAVDIFGVASIAVGKVKFRKEVPESVEILSERDMDRNYYRKIVIDDGVIIGAICIGKVESAGVFTDLIRKKVDVSGIKDLIMREDFDYAKLLDSQTVEDDGFFMKSGELVPS